MTKISKKAQAAETKEAVNTPAEPQAELVEAPKEPISEEPPSDVEFEEVPTPEPAFEFKEAENQDMEPTEGEKQDIEAEFGQKEQGAPFEENVPAPEKEEAFSLEPKKDEVFSLEPTKGDGLPSLDEIKAKERALRKR